MPKPKPLSPEQALVRLRDTLENFSGPLCGSDGKPIRWRVKAYQEGLQFCDSGLLLKEVGYSAINMMVRKTTLEGKLDLNPVPAEHMPILFQRFLDWLALNLPQSREWEVEFVEGCPPIACDRKVVSADVQPD